MKIHYGARSDFSIGESLLQIGDMVDVAKDAGYEALALTDTMSIHGIVDFSNKCKKAGIRPIIGCRVRVVTDPLYRKPKKASGEKEKPNPAFFLKVYPKSEVGLTSLMKLLSKANSAEYFYYHARVGIKDVFGLEDCVVTTGDTFSLMHMRNHREIAIHLQSKFEDDFFIEVCPINTPLFDKLNKLALTCAKDRGFKVVASYPAFYKTAEQSKSLEVLTAITSNETVGSRKVPVQFVEDFYIQEPDFLMNKMAAMYERLEKFHGYVLVKPILKQNELADRATYTFKKQPVTLPKLATDEFAELCRLCIEGWKKRFSGPVFGHQPKPEDMPTYKARLTMELNVLKRMGFSDYFLVVQDLVVWSKQNDVMVGPGRGSVGGSLVAYLLGITDVDPIRFDLLFERFINPERLDLPDADLDFMSSRRHLVIQYLVDKYGQDYVAGISNFSTMASASALRDTGRVHGLSPLEMTATKLVPKEHGIPFALEEAAAAVPEIERFKMERHKIWNHALDLEGCMRAFGQHAAGIVVAGEPIGNRAVVETRGESVVVNWDKRVVEDFGLVKMDILGLSTLDVLQIAKQFIKDRHGEEIDFLKVPLELPDVMEAFGKGETTGVFQFESPGMRKLLRDLAKGGTLTFEDITAATALYRPGPMDSGLMDDFVAIKQGHKEPYYDHPLMEHALKSTYSVIVYQEQVMQLSRDLAGFTGAEADKLRKIMGKKLKDEMAEMRQKWIDGCAVTASMDASTAGMLFDKIEAFAGYGFNRSHSVEYSLISYWTMFLRVRYPAEYFAACMSIVAEDKLPGLVKDAREYGVEVLPPDINHSGWQYSFSSDGHIYAPFSAVMGISENTAKKIVEHREKAGGSFKSFAHFKGIAETVGSKVNSRVVENLEKVGAFAKVEPGQLPARHLDRRKDQTQLMPGLIIDAVKADRTTDVSDKFLRARLIHIVQDYKKCDGCSLAGAPHPVVRCKSTVKYVVVTDCPTWEEEAKDKLMVGSNAEAIKLAIQNASLSMTEGYFTTVVKAKKQDKFLTNEQINGCRKFLEQEMDTIKPAVIVALGNAAIRHFNPGFKGSAVELAGKAIYDPKLEATIIFGINPGQIYIDPSKQEVLNVVFEKVAEVLS